MNPEKLSEAVYSYLRRTIIGSCRGMYRGYYLLAQKKLNKEYFKHGLATYFNDCYRSLIVNDDPVPLKDFAEFRQYGNHSPICLLNIFMQLVVVIGDDHIAFESLDYSSLENFHTSLEKILDPVLTTLKSAMSDIFAHSKCQGESIEVQDPNKPLFLFGLEFEEKKQAKPAATKSTVEPLRHYHHFKVAEIAKYLEAAVRTTSVNTIVSVGSGSGELEHTLRRHFIKLKLSHIKWFLVEPNPPTSVESGCLAPDYSTVPQLLLKNAKISKNCIVLLPWTFPNNMAYDIESIRLLEPKAIVVVYETIGAAGSDQLHHFLSNCEAKSSLEDPYQSAAPLASESKCKELIEHPPYKMHYYHYNLFQGQIGMKIGGLLLLVEKSLPKLNTCEIQCQNNTIDPKTGKAKLDLTKGEHLKQVKDLHASGGSNAALISLLGEYLTSTTFTNNNNQ
jgi:hypothetical protein